MDKITSIKGQRYFLSILEEGRCVRSPIRVKRASTDRGSLRQVVEIQVRWGKYPDRGADQHVLGTSTMNLTLPPITTIPIKTTIIFNRDKRNNLLTGLPSSHLAPIQSVLHRVIIIRQISLCNSPAQKFPMAFFTFKSHMPYLWIILIILAFLLFLKHTKLTSPDPRPLHVLFYQDCSGFRYSYNLSSFFMSPLKYHLLKKP